MAARAPRRRPGGAGALLVLVAALGLGCKGKPAPGATPVAPVSAGAPAEPTAAHPAVAAALELVGQAQRPGTGIDPARLALSLMDDLRQLEAARAAQQHKGTAAQIAEAFQGARPDPALPAGERARRYAAGASRRLGRILRGRCGGELEPLGLKLRMETLTAPVPGAPKEAEALRQRLIEALAPGRLVAVQCEQGSIGMLLVPRDGAWRVIDIVPTGMGRGGPPTPVVE